MRKSLMGALTISMFAVSASNAQTRRRLSDKAHRYIFTLYALDTDKLDVPAGATAAYVGFNLHAHQIAKTTLSAIYGR